MSISATNLSREEQVVWDGLRTMHGGRQAHLNSLRWDLMLKTGIPIAGKVIFEPGAGIGDQTEWLLAQGAARVIVNDGREPNLSVIRKRFADDPRVTCILGNLEDCLDRPEFQITADLVYLWGVYYHINDPIPEFPILRQLARIAPTVVFDYLESATGSDWVEGYDYDHPTTSISRQSPRPTAATMIAGLRKTFGHAYWPKTQMDWFDPCAPSTPRRIIVGSRNLLDCPGLIHVSTWPLT